MYVGSLNWPLPKPVMPQLLTKAPPAENFWTRLFRLSVTYRLRIESTATLSGNSNWPLLVGNALPHFVTNTGGIEATAAGLVTAAVTAPCVRSTTEASEAMITVAIEIVVFT